MEAFPLAFADQTYKYLLRFETVLQISTAKKITVWMDVDPKVDIAVPHNKGKIRIKILRLPKGINTKRVVAQ